MNHVITEHDKALLSQGVLEYRYRVYMLDMDNNILCEINDIETVGSINVDGTSNNRRSTSLSMQLSRAFQDIEDKINGLLCVRFKIQIGVKDLRSDEFVWYDNGIYMLTQPNTTYSASANSLSSNMSDMYSILDGTRNGQVGGAATIIIPAFDGEDNANKIKTEMINVIKAETTVKNYIIEDIGEFYGMPDNNENWESYRENNPDWDSIPYDLEFDSASYVSAMLEEMQGLYPNVQLYFDRYGNLCCNMIPSCEFNPVIIDNDYLQSILLDDSSESVQYSTEDIKNITEVVGTTYDIDRYTETCSTSGNVYTITLTEYEKYGSTEYISFEVDTTNIANMHIKINSLESMPIYKYGTTEYIDEGTLAPDNTYVGVIKTVNKAKVFYWLGQFQPHALCVLSNNADDKTYTYEYFRDKFDCKNITFRIEEDSPYAVQKIGEVLDRKTGDEFENITSETVAMENAIYYNRKSSTLNDTVTLTTQLIPWIDENIKVEYKKQQESESHVYIVQSYSHNTDNNTTSITMYRFYPLYYID